MNAAGGLFGSGEGVRGSVRGSVLGEPVACVDTVREVEGERWRWLRLLGRALRRDGFREGERSEGERRRLRKLGRSQRRDRLCVGDEGGGGGGGGVSMVVGVCEGRCGGCNGREVLWWL